MIVIGVWEKKKQPRRSLKISQAGIRESAGPEMITQQVEQPANSRGTVQDLNTAADGICCRCGEVEQLQPTGGSGSPQKH